MTTSRYEAHTDRNDPNRIVLIDRVGDASQVVTFTDQQGDAIIDAAQAFLDAGIARYGSLDAFDKACRWMLDAESAR